MMSPKVTIESVNKRGLPRKVWIDGKEFPSMIAAAKWLGLTETTFRYRHANNLPMIKRKLYRPNPNRSPNHPMRKWQPMLLTKGTLTMDQGVIELQKILNKVKEKSK